MSTLENEQACHIRILRGVFSALVIKKTQKFHHTEMTSPRRQVSLISFHRRAEDLFSLSTGRWGIMDKTGQDRTLRDYGLHCGLMSVMVDCR